MKKPEETRVLEGGTVELLREADGTMTVVSEGRKLKGAKIVLCAPLTDPDAVASVVIDGKEAAVLRGLSRLSPASRKALEGAKQEHYLTPKIRKVLALEYQFGAVYWKVDTDRGPREFVIKGISQHVRWLSDSRLLLSDVDGNRFEIPDLDALDEDSRDLIGLVL
jgi:hypothetical protein